MRNKCSDPICPAPKGLCLKHLDADYQKCEKWQDDRGLVSDDNLIKAKGNTYLYPWTGEYLQPRDIEIVSQRSSPLIIGMVGSAKAGKTSYLGMLYTLLFNGQRFEKWSFSGSYTLAAWETLAQYLKIKHNGVVEFAPPTPSNPDYYSLYHLALKRGHICRGILFADSSGEVFNLWAEDVYDPNAENAKWIYEKSSGFIFIIDTVALIERRGAARSEIVQMGEQLVANLHGRPVSVVWSKADKIHEVKPVIKSSVEEDLLTLFGNNRTFEVSNFPKSCEDTECHYNNIAVTESLLDRMYGSRLLELIPSAPSTHDSFLNYRGSCRG